MVTALILSGGTGNRLGSDIPKQYIEVNGREVISYPIETLSMSDRIDAIWVVAAEEWQEHILNCMDRFDACGKFKDFSVPGENRQLSIWNGIRDISSWALDLGTASINDLVFVHDAVRPLLTMDHIRDYVDAARGHDGVLPVLPMKDTVYLSSNGFSVSGLLNRSQIYAGQAPEVFRLDKYIEANERLIRYEGDSIARDSEILRINGSTEPAIRAGMDIVMVAGDEGNFKITTSEDLERFQMIISGRQ